MFGFYDPQSLSVEQDKASILFINARDADDIHVVEASSPDEVAQIRKGLENQQSMKISALGCDVVRMSGLIIMSQASPGEGIIQSRENGNIPFVLDFDIPKEQLPQKTRGMVLGFKQDGALIVDRIAVHSGEPTPGKTPADPQSVLSEN